MECLRWMRGWGKGRPGAPRCAQPLSPGHWAQPWELESLNPGGLTCPLPGSCFIQLLDNWSHRLITEGHWSWSFPRWRSWLCQGRAASCQAAMHPGHSLWTPAPAGGVGMVLWVCVCVCLVKGRERKTVFLSQPSAGKSSQWVGWMLWRIVFKVVTSSCAEQLQADGFRYWALPLEKLWMLPAPTAIAFPHPHQLPAYIPATGVQGPSTKSAATLSTSLIIAMGNPHFHSNYLSVFTATQISGLSHSAAADWRAFCSIWSAA